MPQHKAYVSGRIPTKLSRMTLGEAMAFSMLRPWVMFHCRSDQAVYIVSEHTSDCRVKPKITLRVRNHQPPYRPLTSIPEVLRPVYWRFNLPEDFVWDPVRDLQGALIVPILKPGQVWEWWAEFIQKPLILYVAALPPPPFEGFSSPQYIMYHLDVLVPYMALPRPAEWDANDEAEVIQAVPKINAFKIKGKSYKDLPFIFIDDEEAEDGWVEV